MIAPIKHGYTYFPGCSLTATNRSYDLSTRAVAKALDIELKELEDWNCCGATAYMAINEKRSFVLSARNLALAEKEGRDIVTVCNGCYLVLRKTNKYISEDSHLKRDVLDALAAGGMSYGGTVAVRHFLDVIIRDLGEHHVRERIVHPLDGLKVASYYGCQIGRPFGEIDDEEDPQLMDTLVEWMGGERVNYPLKSRCCGGMMMTTQPELGKMMTGRILLNARKSGADCIITTCPLCQINLEAGQKAVSKAMGEDCRIPVLYFTQLLGVSLGLGPEALALKDCFTPVRDLLAEKVGIR